ncbi:MAG: type II secretion system F family protein, partial [Candidatus Eremiobacterota bacterium]
MTLYQSWQRSRRQRKERMNPLETAVFFRQVSTMIGAGADVVTSLRTCAAVAREPARGLLLRLGDRVASGVMLSQAMRELPHTFSPVLCGLVEAGEQGG